MIKFGYPLLLASAALLTACSNKQDANEKNFSAAMDEYLAKHGAMCLSSLTLRKWPVDVADRTGLRFQQIAFATDDAAQLKALEAVGLAKGTDLEIDQLGFNQKPTGSKVKVRRYVLSDTGSKASRDQNGLKDICYADKRIDKVIKWDNVESFGGATETNLSYHYKLHNLQDWARNPDMQLAFPHIKKAIDNAGKEAQRHGVKLTNLGWEARGIDR